MSVRPSVHPSIRPHARVCNEVDDFKERMKQLTKKLIKKGFTINRLKNTMNKCLGCQWWKSRYHNNSQLSLIEYLRHWWYQRLLLRQPYSATSTGNVGIITTLIFTDWISEMIIYGHHWNFNSSHCQWIHNNELTKIHHEKGIILTMHSPYETVICLPNTQNRNS